MLHYIMGFYMWILLNGLVEGKGGEKRPKDRVKTG
jgi:hypothetical protein